MDLFEAEAEVNTYSMPQPRGILAHGRRITHVSTMLRLADITAVWSGHRRYVGPYRHSLLLGLVHPAYLRRPHSSALGCYSNYKSRKLHIS
eukprot:889807-Pyramimonas_sp.AAC.1